MKDQATGAHGGRRQGAGRPHGALNRLTRPVKELAADQGSASIERLVWLRDNAESEQVQFAASRELLDRAYGRARQEIDLTGGNEIRVIIRDFRKEGPSADPQVIDAQPALEHRVTPKDLNAL